MLKGLKGAGVEVLTESKVVAVEPAALRYEDAEGGEHAIEVDRVALALGWRPRGEALAAELERAGVETEVIVLGDALAPADFVAAVNAGADAGLAL